MKPVLQLTPDRKPPNIHLGCGLLETCHPAGKSLGGSQELRALGCRRTLVKRGAHLYEPGRTITSIYSVMAGTFKTCAVTDNGEEQVLGFHMRGAIMGLDAIATGQYTNSAVALEDSQVCMVSVDSLEQHCGQDKSVEKRIHAAMGKEINTRQRMMLFLGRKSAEERVASFLIELAAAYFALGYSSSEMTMLMTRADIGSYLGLKLETVSRILSNLQHRQLLAVNLKRVRILDSAKLAGLTGDSIGMFGTTAVMCSAARSSGSRLA